MAPLIVLAVATLILRIFFPWRDATRIALAIMFLFTSSAHFTAMKYDLAAMIPPPFTGSLWLIHLTGVLEIAGAIGLLIPRFQRVAGICLILLLLALFPGNVYAALHDIPLRGRPPTPLWIRAPLQLFWIFLLWWSAVWKPRLAVGTAAVTTQP